MSKTKSWTIHFQRKEWGSQKWKNEKTALHFEEFRPSFSYAKKMAESEYPGHSIRILKVVRF